METPQAQPRTKPTIGSTLPPTNPERTPQKDKDRNEPEQEQSPKPDEEQNGTAQGGAAQSLKQAQQVTNLATGGGVTSIALKSPLFSWLQKPFPVLHWILSNIPLSVLIPLAEFIPLVWGLGCLILGLPFTKKIKIPLFSSLLPRPTPFEFVASLTLLAMLIFAVFFIVMATLCFTLGGQAIKTGLNFLYNAGISCGN